MRNNSCGFEMSGIQAHLFDLCVPGIKPRTFGKASRRAGNLAKVAFGGSSEVNRLFDRIHCRTPRSTLSEQTDPRLGNYQIERWHEKISPDQYADENKQ